MERLEATELVALVQRVFQVRESDHALAILVDLPDEHTPDNPRWQARRAMAADWAAQLAPVAPQELGLEVHLYHYPNARHNNADLPGQAWRCAGGAVPEKRADLPAAGGEDFAKIFASHSILLAPTHFSATAPLKLAAKDYGFRAATMPGFTAEMIPALRLNYQEINARVRYLKGLLDEAVLARCHFTVAGAGNLSLDLDLRHRSAHASGGLFPDDGVAGNLPSGETYIVPYEGEVPGDPSRSAGIMPVQFGDEVVLYRIEKNRALEVVGDGPTATRERETLAREPAYGNLAELGLGVLSDYGLEPTGEILLDEKLGLHIAFGRSDHFGGQVGAKDFSEPAAVVHIDRVYLPQTMPRVHVPSVDLHFPDGRVMPLIRDHQYVVDFPA